MRAGVLALAVSMAAAWYGPALAQGSIEERLQRMEQRIRYLEERVAAQDRTIVEKDKRISELKGLQEGWFNALEVSGAVEIEAAHVTPEEGDSTSGLEAATVDLAFAAELNDWVSAEAALTMDEGAIVVDSATATLALPDSPISLTLGKQGLPFGVYESNLISDPLTKELGDTAEDAAVVAFDSGGVTASAFLFKGENDREDSGRIEDFGAAVGWAMEVDRVSVGFNLSWINDIGESDTLEGTETKGADMVPGGAASAILSVGGATVIGEYVTALEDFSAAELAFNGAAARPSAAGLEAAYGFEVAGTEVTVATAWQSTGEAAGLLPESRFLVGTSIGIAEGLSLSLEWARERDYDTGDGGSGETTDTATAVLAAEF